MKNSGLDGRTRRGKRIHLLEEIAELKEMNNMIKKENRALAREIVKYKGQLVWHIKNGTRLMEKLKECESENLGPCKPDVPIADRSIDELSDDEINRLIDKKRKEV